MCEPISNYGGQRQCGYCQLMMGNGPIATMDGHAGLMKNSCTSHTIDNCNGIKGNAMSHDINLIGFFRYRKKLTDDSIMHDFDHL